MDSASHPSCSATARSSQSNLDRPTSLEIINNIAYVVTVGGEIWTIDNIAGPPFGRTASSNPTTKGNR